MAAPTISLVLRTDAPGTGGARNPTLTVPGGTFAAGDIAFLIVSTEDRFWTATGNVPATWSVITDTFHYGDEANWLGHSGVLTSTSAAALDGYVLGGGTLVNTDAWQMLLFKVQGASGVIDPANAWAGDIYPAVTAAMTPAGAERLAVIWFNSEYSGQQPDGPITITDPTLTQVTTGIGSIGDTASAYSLWGKSISTTLDAQTISVIGEHIQRTGYGVTWFGFAPASGSGPADYPISGAAAATTGGTGHVTAKLGVTGHADVTSTASGAVTMKFPVTGTAVSTSAAQGAITARLPVLGVAAAVSTTQGSVTANLGVQGTASAVSAASGSVTMTFDVSGTAVAVSGSSGAVSGEDGLSGTAAASSGSTGQITATLHISGHSDSYSGAQGALEYADGLSGSAAAESDSGGAVTANRAVSGTIAAYSAASGALVGSWAVSGTAPAISGASGDVHVTGEVIPPWPKEMTLDDLPGNTLTMIELVNALTVTELTFELTLDAV